MRTFIASIGIMVGLMVTLAGCSPGSSPEGAPTEAQTGTGNIQATGAGIMYADANNITYSTKCSVCGTAGETKTIPTPTAKRPYKTSWSCPQCKHRQMIMFKLRQP
jgi:hypothetical protein